MSSGCSRSSSKLPSVSLPQCLFTLTDLRYVERYSEIRATKKGQNGESICQKEKKKKVGRGIWERIQGDFLPFNLQEVSGCSFNTFCPGKNHLKIETPEITNTANS